MSTVRVKFSYDPQLEDELKLTKGEIITILEKSSDGWWKGETNGQTGWFPSTYVVEIETDHEPEQESIKSKVIEAPLEYSAIIKPKKDAIASKPVLETVVALWDFQASSPEEISFSKDEHLDIIERPENDPEWWLARNFDGKSGLIPKNYVQSQNLEVHEQDTWNFGQISRDESERILRTLQKGDFLVRDSESNKGDYSISVRSIGILVRHFKIKNQHGNLLIGSKSFTNMADLIEHYKTYPIFDSGNEKLYLVRPAKR